MSDRVDVARLGSLSASSGTIEDLELADAALAVLAAAPVRWLCRQYETLDEDRYCCGASQEHEWRCGWVALVPVVGGPDAS